MKKYIFEQPHDRPQRRSKIGWTKLSKRMFYALGAFSNPRLCRQMVGGAWSYWMT